MAQGNGTRKPGKKQILSKGSSQIGGNLFMSNFHQNTIGRIYNIYVTI